MGKSLGNFDHEIIWLDLHDMFSFWLQGRCQKGEIKVSVYYKYCLGESGTVVEEMRVV